MKIVQIIISGGVQGVYFRAFTQKQAIKNKVFGFVSNKDDGTVEVIAQAKSANLDRFIGECHKGSFMAKVDKIIVTDYSEAEIFSAFEIR